MRTSLFLILTIFTVSSAYASKVTCYFSNNTIFTTTGTVVLFPNNYRITADDGKNYYVPMNNCIIEF